MRTDEVEDRNTVMISPLGFKTETQTRGARGREGAFSMHISGESLYIVSLVVMP